MTGQDGFARLLETFPWPDEPRLPGVEPFTWALDGGGRHLIDAVIAARPGGLIVEIGSFMGGAARRWLSENRTLRCVCVDPWGRNLVAYVAALETVEWARRAYGVEALRRHAATLAEHGPLATVRNNLAEFRDRCALLPLGVPEAFARLREAGLAPDIVFLDALKRREEFLGADAAFPDAILCGDDWSWKDEAGDHPVRRYAAEIARRRGGTLFADRATFVLAEPRHGLALDPRHRAEP